MTANTTRANAQNPLVQNPQTAETGVIISRELHTKTADALFLLDDFASHAYTISQTIKHLVPLEYPHSTLIRGQINMLADLATQAENLNGTRLSAALCEAACPESIDPKSLTGI